jgi:hypothetical protein
MTRIGGKTYYQCKGSGPGNAECKNLKSPQRTQSKTILCKNELSKRILETAIEVLSVKRGATVVFYLLKSLRSLRLCGDINLGIPVTLAHFRHLLFCDLVLTLL